MREFYKKKLDCYLYPIGNTIDPSTQEQDKDFFEWLSNIANNYIKNIKRTDKCFKLWHLNGSIDSCSNEQTLFSFYELDNPTEEEVNISKNQKNIIFSSKYTCNIFKDLGCNNVHYVPLAFDKYNFKKLDKKYFHDDRITFNLVGKLEKRKHHKKVIQSWIKKYGNDARYSLQCSIYNPFLKEEDQKNLILSILEGKNYFNVNFLGFMSKNIMYNDYLNSGDIIIGMSGGEGWGLPEFHSVALGKHAIILNAHAYKDWANKDNSVLVNPCGKIEAFDNMFFHRGQPFNQGSIFDFDADDFINACELAIDRVNKNRINSEGLKLQEEFNVEKMADKILEITNN